MWTAYDRDHKYLRFFKKGYRRFTHWEAHHTKRRWATAEAAIKVIDAEYPLTVPDPIQKAISEFREQHQEWTTLLGAKDQCGHASSLFCAFLIERAILTDCGCIELVLDEKHDLPNIPALYEERPDQSHYVVKVGDLLVDWTARQYPGPADAGAYTDGAPYPVVWDA
jgi:hypothetical protein